MKPGDIIFSKDLGCPISETITYWSPYLSHVEMAYLPHVSLNITFPRPKFRNINELFDGKHRIIIIRPKFHFNSEGLERAIYDLYKNYKYDLVDSFLGHIFGKDWQSKRKRINCSTGFLKVWRGLGCFKNIKAERFKPRDAYMLMMGMVEAEQAEVIFQKDRAIIEDFLKLKEINET